jgi:hypothetical protein
MEVCSFIAAEGNICSVFFKLYFIVACHAWMESDYPLNVVIKLVCIVGCKSLFWYSLACSCVSSWLHVYQ